MTIESFLSYEETRQLTQHSSTCVKRLELHLDSVFRFSISQYFLGILPTNTEGKLGKNFLVLCLWREYTHQKRFQLNSTAIRNITALSCHLSSCRQSPLSCRPTPCCPLPSSCPLSSCHQSPLSCHPSLSPCCPSMSSCHLSPVTKIGYFGTYLQYLLPIPRHIVVTSFQLIPVGSQISIHITLGLRPHHLQWN